MRDASTIMRERQRTIRAELDRRNISLKAVSFESGITYSTLCSYFPGNERGAVEKQPAEMPSGAVFRLCGAIPNDLLNLLFPDGFALVRVPEGIDFDEISASYRDFIDEKERAHHPDSEAGRDIGPNEHNSLAGKVVRMVA